MPKLVNRVPFTPKLERKKRVAAYARVSSGKDAMLHSLSSQVAYYSELIQKHSGWEYAGVYADEALTGTKENRDEYQRLLADCRAGRIDMVITKSISRFAWNTVTLLEAIRELKMLRVDVFFEEENIYSFDGKISMPYKQFLGYEKGADGAPVVNEKEAHIVRLIYQLFLEGKTPAGICRYLDAQGIPTPSGKQKWSQTTVDSILTNEKYKGDAFLQKKFI